MGDLRRMKRKMDRDIKKGRNVIMPTKKDVEEYINKKSVELMFNGFEDKFKENGESRS